MKSIKFLAAAVAALALTACSSSNDDVTAPQEEGNLSSSDYQVQLNVVSMAPSASLTSHSAGTVGIDSVVAQRAANDTKQRSKWHGERFYVYQMDKGTMTPTVLTYTNLAGQITNYKNTLMVAPGSTKYTDEESSNTGLSIADDGQYRYYPLQGKSDFWAYYIDDAYASDAEKTAKTPSPTVSDTQASVNFVINGGQDIMAAATDRASDITTSTVPSLTQEDLYSAKAARASVQPTLVFKHMLTRLTFTGAATLSKYTEEALKITPSDIYYPSGTADEKYKADQLADGSISTGVYVDTIRVKGVKTGNLVFAYTAATGSQTINWTGTAADSTWFTLQQRTQFKNAMTSVERKAATATTEAQRTLVSLTPKLVPLNLNNGKRDSVQIGDAVLLQPNEKYNIVFRFHQYIPVWTQDEIDRRHDSSQPDYDANFKQQYKRVEFSYPKDPNTYYQIPINAKMSGGKPVSGYSYNIALTINGLEDIKISSQLGDWENGGTVPQQME